MNVDDWHNNLVEAASFTNQKILGRGRDAMFSGRCSMAVAEMCC